MQNWTGRAGVTEQLPRWSETEARKALAEWDRSGETAVAFAARNGVSTQRLRYWRKRLSPAITPGAVTFAEVDVGAHSAATIEVVYRDVVVRVREQIEAPRLACIVRALAQGDPC